MVAPFEVNFFGVVKVINAFLPHMRSRRDGTIVIIGSRSVYFNEFPVRQTLFFSLFVC
jgi:NADP-dependent 3-hydroxy acid dehydrogenase YdfG